MKIITDVTIYRRLVNGIREKEEIVRTTSILNIPREKAVEMEELLKGAGYERSNDGLFGEPKDYHLSYIGAEDPEKRGPMLNITDTNGKHEEMYDLLKNKGFIKNIETNVC